MCSDGSCVPESRLTHASWPVRILAAQVGGTLQEELVSNRVISPSLAPFPTSYPGDPALCDILPSHDESMIFFALHQHWHVAGPQHALPARLHRTACTGDGLAMVVMLRAPRPRAKFGFELIASDLTEESGEYVDR